MVEATWSLEVADFLLHRLSETNYRRFGGRLDSLRDRLDAGTWDDPTDPLSRRLAGFEDTDLRGFETKGDWGRQHLLAYYVADHKIIFLVVFVHGRPLQTEAERAHRAMERAKRDGNRAEDV